MRGRTLRVLCLVRWFVWECVSVEVEESSQTMELSVVRNSNHKGRLSRRVTISRWQRQTLRTAFANVYEQLINKKCRTAGDRCNSLLMSPAASKSTNQVTRRHPTKLYHVQKGTISVVHRRTYITGALVCLPSCKHIYYMCFIIQARQHKGFFSLESEGIDIWLVAIIWW